MEDNFLENLVFLAAESLPIGILVVDEVGKIIYLNKAFQNLAGIPNEAVKKNINDVMEETLMSQVLKTGEIVTKIIFTANGQEAVLEERPLFHNGKLVGGISLLISQEVRSIQMLKHKLSLLEQEIEHYQERLAVRNIPDKHFQPFISNNPKMQEVVKLAERVAASDVNILITGETGTGKDLLSTAIHHKSKRANRPFIKINCAAIPANLLESELFGYEGGAFTSARSTGKPGKFELAHKGTIFLDEIGDMPLEMQAKILRVIQEREFERVGGTKPIKVDVRIIAATNRDLKDMVDKKLFREDLYFRLNVVELHLPPLRERREDIPYLIRTILAKLCHRYEIPAPEIDPAAFQMLMNYDWPGNVRELENVLERAINLAPSRYIGPEHLPPALRDGMPVGEMDPKGLLGMMVDNFEKQKIIDALKATGGNKVRAAKMLGISRTGLYKKLRKYGLLTKVYTKK
ncbi:sigma-54 interaction domain-containing protein [Calderihabitans maritimus]|uniref:Fis family transcriptional regulator n=1 Tax=Calderihabitans maritimus TaxID=1246530 RepID=A0A1Z5HNS7_9FIRM|nr:sigma 54-interacting transcriptional regulator [Calderihabitans maritimus]GAW91108.1 Fis family transcriptional regulator [Calderihabitans maritimus]